MSAPTQAPIKRSLDTEAQFLKGVGPKLAQILAKLEIHTVRDVLFHLPRRYEDRRNIPPLNTLRPGEFATVRGGVLAVQGNPAKRGMVIIRVPITDGRSTVVLTWFNQPWIKRKFEQFRGEVIAYGKVKEGSYELEIHSPEFELIGEEDDPADFARIVPVYPLTDGVDQRLVRRAASSALLSYLEYVVDPIPEPILRKNGLQPLRWSLSQIHDPTNEENRIKARQRLVFDEFFNLQLSLALARADNHHETGLSFPIHKEKDILWKDIHAIVPFALTGAQKRVIEEIWTDMEAPHPMNRLVQGDVGCGKTIVAACAMLAAVRAGYQTALMAPTEILAEQHFASFSRLLEPLGIEVVLLVGKHTATKKKQAYKDTESGKAKIAIGTHAIIQEGVKFEKLGLIVVDEQHRFGVLQRAALREKGFGNPDVLVMTATPIPRTLTMAVFGDMDISVIDELPPGRRPVKTHWKFLADRHSVYQGVHKLIKEGRQAYFVCPLVSETETAMALAADDLHKRLSEQVFPDLRVGLLHGQMKPKDKESVMEQFRKHELDILVSTTVIEVGVDVPNASVMVIEDANRFGLSQLHQLRGRVGRGETQSYCILVSDAKSEDSKARLDIMVGTTDGFKIAEEDLKLRGPGDLIGTKQSGNLDIKIGDLVQDGKMMEVARQAALNLIKFDPTLSRPEHRLLVESVKARKGEKAIITVS
ncbi:MAG TPA: ATP-dependent DNA helicase RecG [Fimbriimonadaceae bacterium]|jgi:ATP-dependent DNA helicase RecG